MLYTSDNLTEQNIDLVKRHLKITWSDADTDAQLIDIISDAALTLDAKLGAEIDYFTAPGHERRMLLEYCLYLWNDAGGEFDENYKNNILQLRVKNAQQGAEDEAD